MEIRQQSLGVSWYFQRKPGLPWGFTMGETAAIHPPWASPTAMHTATRPPAVSAVQLAPRSKLWTSPGNALAACDDPKWGIEMDPLRKGSPSCKLTLSCKLAYDLAYNSLPHLTV
jgi:hypothetical protein